MQKSNIIALALVVLSIFASCNREAAKENTITLSTENLIIPRNGKNADGDNITITVKANTYWRAFMPETCEWITYDPKASSETEAEVSFTVEPNLDGEERKVTISFEDNGNVKKLLHITQQGADSAPHINVTLPGKTWTELDTLVLLANNRKLKFFYKDGSFTSNEDLPLAENYAVVYPYDESASFDGTAISVNFAQTQEFKTAEGINSAARYGAVGTSSDFALDALFGTFRVNISGNGSIVGFTLNSFQDSWNVNPDSPVLLSEDAVPVDFVLPAGARTNCELSIVDAVGYQIPYEIEDFEVANGEIEEVSVRYERTSARVDLSANGTANCYVTSGAIKAKFKATRGNEADIIPGIESVGLVWRGQVGATDLTDKIVRDEITYEDGYVLFETDGNQGNAVIAAYDEYGVILWSWHIWALTEENALTEITMGESTFLDRNLGAYTNDRYLSNGYYCSVNCAGLLYQWGRKDPFGGRGKEATNSGSPVAMLDINNEDCKLTDAGPVTVAETVKHPTTVYTRSSGHWASDIADTWGGSVKTIYDPCPYGYRVPAKVDYGSNWTTSTVKVVEDEVDAPGNPTGVQGFRWTVGGKSTFIPVTGQLNAGTAALNHAYLGSEMTSVTSSNRQAVCRTWTRENTHTWADASVTINSGAVWSGRRTTVNISSNQNAYCMAVRCVKE